MAAHFDSKHGTVSRIPEELYMQFTDMRNLLNAVPEQYKDDVKADADSVNATVKGFNIGVRVAERQPYSLIRLSDDNGPFPFGVTFHFDRAPEGKTDFFIEADAELNYMMKIMLGSKIQEALDKVVDTLVDLSEGKRPDIPADIAW